MELKLLQSLICRTPAFSIHATMAELLPELKAKIKESSPLFSNFIEPLTEAELQKLDDKIRYTLWKYANRAKYRSTPYGSFAAVSLLPLATQPQSIIINKQMECDHFIDWSYRDELSVELKNIINPETILSCNSSLYFVADRVRYLRVRDGNHELAAVQNIPELDTILQFFKSKQPAGQSYPLMAEKFEMNSEMVNHFLQQLLGLQLLFSDNCANITGDDYFKRLNIQRPISPNDYIISKRKVQSGGFYNHHLKKIPSYIRFLAHQFPLDANADLDSFKSAFIHRFEYQEISLAMAMDPEIGIGYGNLAQLYNSNPLINEIKSAGRSAEPEILGYGSFHAFLLNKIIIGEHIKIEDFKSTENLTNFKLPNSLSILFHIYKDQVVIASAGGATATALIGRFTMGNPDIESYAKHISNLESRANPEVVFFDVAYQVEQRVDNVNRRKLLYPFELPILSWSTTTDPLDFADILVSVLNDEVVLRSKKLGKRLIPRMPTAYNAKGSDLAVYRFLNDIQNQSLITNLGFKLSDFFPKLTFYPRVSFENLIVSPAMWLVPAHLYRNTLGDVLSLLKTWLTTEKIHFRFKSGYADATLCFDPHEKEDLLAFLSFCRQQPDEVYISEALIDDSSCISGDDGLPYFPQYIANFAHEQLLYPKTHKLSTNSIKIKSVQMPGGEWLYFELYSHAGKSNLLLLNQIQHFMQCWQGKLKKWFFIRYNEPSAHLRLRLHLKNNRDGFSMMEALKSLLEPEMQLGTLKDFKIKTYVQETHRYGHQRMDLIEQFFMADSQCVLYLLKKTNEEDKLVATSLEMLQNWLAIAIPSLADQISFISKMADNFAEEMQLSPTHFKKINANFNTLKNVVHQLAIKPKSIQVKNYERLIHKILQKTIDQTDLENLLSNLIHMHINRLFSSDQRLYETLIYHYLLKILQMRKARSNI